MEEKNIVNSDFDDDDFADWLPGGMFTDMSKKTSAKQLVIDTKHGKVTASKKIIKDDFDELDDDFEFGVSETHAPNENDFSLFEENEPKPIKVRPIPKKKVYSDVKVHEKNNTAKVQSKKAPVKKNFSVHLSEIEEEEDILPAPVNSSKKKKPEVIQKKQKEKIRVKVSPLKVVAIILIICILGLFGTVSRLLKGVNHIDVENDWDDTIAAEAPQWELADYRRFYNVLIIGADASLDTTARSDTMIIVSLDRVNRTIKLASLLRDNYVEIPGHGSNRLNAAFAFGGAPLLMQTVEKNFRIKIDKFICVDFDGLEGIVNSIGGVDMQITDAEARYINRYSERGTKTLVGGYRHLNGNEALHYARIRKLDSDFGRTNRQRKLIQQLATTCRGLGVSKLLEVVKCASTYMTTNMSNRQIIWLGIQGVLFSGKEMEQISIPIEGGYQSKTINGMAVLAPDLDKNCTELHNFLFGKTPAPIK